MNDSVKSDRIAKLLATEDVTVRHSVTAKTASFDTKSRVLTLPVYLVKNDNVHDMMTGHEVGHALWTKPLDWMTALTNEYNKDILNIVEDARIEKKIKVRYPGIVRNFIEGYNILAGNKFFYDDESQIVDMQFIDRMNLYFKLGLSAKVKFNAEEQELVEMVADCNSWKEVLAATRAIMEFTAQEMRDEENEEGDVQEIGQFGESNELESDVSKMTNEELSDELDSQNMKSETQDKFDENAEKMTEGEKNELRHSRNYSEPLYGRLPKANLGTVVIPYKKIIKQLDIDIEYSKRYAIIDSDSRGIEKHFYASMEGDYVTFDTIESRYKTFRTKTAKIVNYMVKEFERKKAAAEYRKEHISKTGVLDVNKLFSYKYNEDVFLKNIIKPDGKNHGMVFLLDWSASMTDHLGATVNQLLSLIWFCKKINVPFEVYAFTNGWKSERFSEMSLAEMELEANERFSSNIGEIQHANHTCFNLMQLFSTKMNASDLNKMCKMIYTFAHAYQGMRNPDSKFGMGSTPLVEGLSCLTQIIPMLKNNYNLDIVNLFVLTDGDGNSHFSTVLEAEGRAGIGPNLVVENPVTKKSYNTGELGRSLRNQGSYHYNNNWIKLKGQEYAVLNIIKETPGVNMVGLFLDGSSMNGRYNKHVHDKFMQTRMWSEMKRKHIEQRKYMKKYGFTSHKWMAYDAFYIIPAATIRDNTEELQITSDMKAGQMKRIFGQHQKKKWNSRVFVNRLMEIIC